MISIQWNGHKSPIFTNCSNKSRPWISNIRTENFGADDKDRDACRSRKSEVDLWITEESILHCDETFIQLFFYFCWVNDPLGNLCLIESVLDALFDVISELCFDEIRYFFSKDAMTIGDSKEMSSSIFTKMWKNKVRVLVDFVGVLWTVSSLCGKWELGNAVIKLFLRLWSLSWLSNWLWSGHLTSNWCSEFLVISTSTVISTTVVSLFRGHLPPLINRLISTRRCWVKVWQSNRFLILTRSFAWLRSIKTLMRSPVHVQGTIPFSLHILFPDLNWFWRVY